MTAQPTPVRPATMEVQVEYTSTPPRPLIPQAIITTHRLVIRPMHPQDSRTMSLNANNKLITKYMSLSFPSPYTLIAAEGWINMNLAKSPQDNFVICEKMSPEIVIGGIGLKPGVDVSAHTAEVGFWIGESYWRRGYTTEALESFTQWVFFERLPEGTQTTRLCGKVFSGNDASMRCFEKCGFLREGILKGHCEKHGQVFDEHLFGITKAHWQQRWSSIYNNY